LRYQGISGSIILQEVMGITNLLLSVIGSGHGQRKNNEGSYTQTDRQTDRQTHRQKHDLISLITKIRGDAQTDEQTQTDKQTAR
jgi:hypothetical protein